ncbi:MAG TPA: hypothetical protein ACQGQH_01175 [Xylella sp.]
MDLPLTVSVWAPFEAQYISLAKTVHRGAAMQLAALLEPVACDLTPLVHVRQWSG